MIKKLNVTVAVFCGSDLLDKKHFCTLGQAAKFISLHRSTTYGCYSYLMLLSDE